jgi:hypothetical protein
MQNDGTVRQLRAPHFSACVRITQVYGMKVDLEGLQGCQLWRVTGERIDNVANVREVLGTLRLIIRT